MFLGPLPNEGTPSAMFEDMSNSATVPNLVSKATVFFIRFKQVEMNDLDLVDFWALGLPMWTSMDSEYLMTV